MKLSESRWPADTSQPVRETTVGSVLREAAARAPNDTAMVEGKPDASERRRWTFAELLGDAEAVAAALLERFEPGERAAVWAPNIPEGVLLELGAGLAGIVLVTVNPAYRPKELSYVLRQSGSSGIFLVPEYRSPMARFLEEVRPELPDLREVIYFTEWADFVATGPGSARLPEVTPDQAAQIQYTSGTTGFPKGALLHHRGLTNNARFFAERLNIGPGDSFLDPMPMFHTAGCVLSVLGPLQAGAAHLPVLAFEPGLLLELMETERTTGTLMVPTMLIGCMEHPDFTTRDLSSMKYVISGGATVPADLVARIETALGIPLLIVYGTTECSPAVTLMKPDDNFEDRTLTLGSALPQTELEIVDRASGEVVPTGAVGELCVRGYLVMTGYYEMPDATASAIEPEGWYHTGDLASMDERGYLKIEGRLKDMIIRGGENIYPREIEDVLFTHPKVAEAAVVGIPDGRWGEVVAAFVRPTPGTQPAEEELFSYCREHLAPHKTPRHWVFIDAFPLTASGKIQKFVLREQYGAKLGDIGG